jgi:hypothetical protein
MKNYFSKGLDFLFYSFISFKRKLSKKYDKFMEQEPQIKSEYVGKVVYLLRRDFPIEEQNEIMLAVTKKLNQLRAEDMDKMAREYEHTQNHTNSFKISLGAL